MERRKTYRWLIWIILAVVLIAVALWHLLVPYIDRWKSARDYEKMAQEYVSIVSESEEGKQAKKDWWFTDVTVQLGKMREKNEDIIGWIRFDNQNELRINYPIFYSGDNEKYVRRDINGDYHIAGSIFLEGLNQKDFSDYYNILYGHNMNDGSMFGSLKKYKDEGFWENNQYFTVYTETTAYRYRIFAYENAVNGGEVYKVGYQPGEEYQIFIDHMLANSDIETGIKPQTSQKILTLSTCTGEGYSDRFAVLAVCVDAQTTDRDKVKISDITVKIPDIG